MEKRSSHYKVSRAQFVLINRVVVYTRKMYIGCYKSGTKLSWHADSDIIYGLITVYKLALPAFNWGLLKATPNETVVSRPPPASRLGTRIACQYCHYFSKTTSCAAFWKLFMEPFILHC